MVVNDSSTLTTNVLFMLFNWLSVLCYLVQIVKVETILFLGILLFECVRTSYPHMLCRKSHAHFMLTLSACSSPVGVSSKFVMQVKSYDN